MFFEIRIWKESESAIKLPDVSWSLKGDNSLRHIVQVLTKNHFFGWSNWSDKDQFHSPYTANVCLETSTPSLHAARWSSKNKWMWDVVLSMIWTIFINAETLRISYLFETPTKAFFLFSFFFSILFSSKDLLFDCKSYHWGKKIITNNNK